MIEHLIGLMTKNDLSEIDLSEGEQRIRLRKGFAPSPSPYLPPVSNPGVHAPAPPAPGSPKPPESAKKYHEIKSPMVGTFYAKAAPDKPDYVSVGSRVRPDTVVCK